MKNFSSFLPHPAIFPTALANLFLTFVLLTTPGCFTITDGGRNIKSGTGIYIRKKQKRDIHLGGVHLVTLYGDSPLRNFVVEFYYHSEPENHFFVEVDFDLVFSEWEYQTSWNPKENFQLPKLSDPDYWEWRIVRRDFTTKLPLGFTTIPNIHDYWDPRQISEMRHFSYSEGIDWARFGRYWYQVPLDIVTSPFQLLFFTIDPFGLNALGLRKKKSGFDPPHPEPVLQMEKPETWERADVEKVVREYFVRREKYEEDVRQWRIEYEAR